MSFQSFDQTSYYTALSYGILLQSSGFTTLQLYPYWCITDHYVKPRLFSKTRAESQKKKGPLWHTPTTEEHRSGNISKRWESQKEEEKKSEKIIISGGGGVTPPPPPPAKKKKSGHYPKIEQCVCMYVCVQAKNLSARLRSFSAPPPPPPTPRNGNISRKYT